jgi:hypothetical protein
VIILAKILKPKHQIPLNVVKDLLNSLSDINTKFNYSTTEIKIGTWINGKPIYRKVFTTTLSSSDSEKDKALSDSTINIDELVTLKGNLKNTFGNWFPLSNINPNGTLNNGVGLYYSSDLGICIRIGALYLDTNSRANVTIEYTKTTD